MRPFWFLVVLLPVVTSFSSHKILPQKYRRQVSLRAVSSNENNIITFAEKAFVTLSILFVGYEVFSQGENMKVQGEAIRAITENMKVQGEAIRTITENMKVQSDVVNNIDMKFNIAGGGILLTIGLLALSSSVVDVLEYFDKKSERVQKK